MSKKKMSIPLTLLFTYHAFFVGGEGLCEFINKCVENGNIILPGDWGGGGLFRLSNITIVVFFYYLSLLKMLHVSVSRVNPSKFTSARRWSYDRNM
jgi:hypothetical protein